jgi:site-specific DNA recombinase
MRIRNFWDLLLRGFSLEWQAVSGEASADHRQGTVRSGSGSHQQQKSYLGKCAGFVYTGLLKCAECGCSITAEIKKGRYIYYHCTFDKGKCGGSYVREEELERQFCEILRQFQFSQVVFDWTREALRLSQAEKAEFHQKTIEKLNSQYLKLQNRIDQMYLDKLDGMVDEAFYRKHLKEWREDQKRLQRQIEEHRTDDDIYLEQGIRLIETACNAHAFYQSKNQPICTELIRFIFPNSNLRDGKVEPVFKPPFDIIWKLAREARKYKPEQKKEAVEDLSTACPTALAATNTKQMTTLH